jgi:hypothetical protein
MRTPAFSAFARVAAAPKSTDRPRASNALVQQTGHGPARYLEARWASPPRRQQLRRTLVLLPERSPPVINGSATVSPGIARSINASLPACIVARTHNRVSSRRSSRLATRTEQTCINSPTFLTTTSLSFRHTGIHHLPRARAMALIYDSVSGASGTNRQTGRMLSR